MENNFVHLNLHTEYSLSEGVNSIDSFLVKAKELGMTSLAVTDYANMFCAIEFYQKAKKMGIKPIIGLELPITNRDEQNIFSLTLLAKNYNGYKNLVKLASELYKKNENRELKLNKEILKEHSQDLIALSSSMNGEIGKAILTNSSDEKVNKIIDEYIEIFSKENFYLEIQANELSETKIINDRKIMKNKIFLLTSILSLTGCTPAYDDLNEWMTKTRQDAKSHIIPFEAPVVNPPAVYNPPAYGGLNAFDFRRLDNAPKGSNAPNPNRPKEALEAFSLENMRYVGMLSNGSKTAGFIDVNGHVYTVYPGNYIGQNYGKIQSITDDLIVLTELVEDSSGNWIYRKAELPLSNNAENSSNDVGNALATNSN